MITNLGEDLTMNVINYFNIKMLRNFGLVDKSGMENIQKFLGYRKNIISLLRRPAGAVGQASRRQHLKTDYNYFSRGGRQT